MNLVDQIVNAAGEVLGPISENTVNSTVKGVREVIRDELIAKLSGKKLIVTIEIPDLTK